ncbi:hypothetical protein HMPREF3226_00214 [Prevotella corporis]|uniref:Uncharacterized protein n=1 Tax=Prevotella corporis TaxID=28128 RepID=A0A133QN32_9BACT|nr:hypothetical protein HMPREF3226_00214 [Prevotella corporis]
MSFFLQKLIYRMVKAHLSQDDRLGFVRRKSNYFTIFCSPCAFADSESLFGQCVTTLGWML